MMNQPPLPPEVLYQWVSTSGRILGTLYYNSPEKESVQSILSLFQQHDWQWGELTLAADTRTGLQQQQNLEEAYQDLFIGPNEMPAPPWGSVYLDKESVFFGDSALALQAFMRTHNINLLSEMNEPADHIGLMLMLAAYLSENQRELLPTLLREHLFTWCYRYLTLLGAEQQYPFYSALAKLTEQTLQDWQQQFNIREKDVKLYR